MSDVRPQDQLVRLHHMMRWTLRAFYWLDESLQNLLAQDGWERGSHTETMVILAIGEGHTKPSDLGRLLGISRQAIHQVINTLQRKGLVSLKEDPDDRRSKIVYFNPRAVKIRQSAIKAVATIEREVAKRIGQKAYHNMVSGLSQDWGEAIGGKTATPSRAQPRAKAR